MTVPTAPVPGSPFAALPNILPGIGPDILLFRHAATDMGDGPRRYIGRTEVPLSTEGRARAAAWRPRLAGLHVVGAYASPLQRARETARLMLGQGEVPDTPDAPDTSCMRSLAAIPLTILDDLAEMDLGEWEGQVQMQVREARPDAYARRGREPWTFRPPGGECCADVAARGLRALAAMWRDCSGTGGWPGNGGRGVGTAGAEGQNATAGQQCLPDCGVSHGHAPVIVAVSHAGLIRSVLCALGHMGREELLTLPVRHLHCVRLRRHAPEGGGTAAATAPTSAGSRASAAWSVVSPDWQP